MRRDGGSVFPAHANTGDPNGPVARDRTRADIHDGPEPALQLKAGYIDARPLTANSSKSSCYARPDHTVGSKPVMLRTSKCCPLCPRVHIPRLRRGRDNNAAGALPPLHHALLEHAAQRLANCETAGVEFVAKLAFSRQPHVDRKSPFAPACSAYRRSGRSEACPPSCRETLCYHVRQSADACQPILILGSGARIPIRLRSRSAC